VAGDEGLNAFTAGIVWQANIVVEAEVAALHSDQDGRHAASQFFGYLEAFSAACVRPRNGREDVQGVEEVSFCYFLNRRFNPGFIEGLCLAYRHGREGGAVIGPEALDGFSVGFSTACVDVIDDGLRCRAEDDGWLVVGHCGCLSGETVGRASRTPFPVHPEDLPLGLSLAAADRYVTWRSSHHGARQGPLPEWAETR